MTKKPWEQRPKKKGKPTKLTPELIAAAKKRAKEAGRTYPNLIDNMWAAQQAKATKDLP